MLTFIGLGLYDEEDISLKGLEAIRNADVIFAEFYTSPLGGKTIEAMERIYGKRVFILERNDIEETAEEGILKLAKYQKVALLCGGDAMVATTHLDLQLRAIDMGIETRIVHAASISSAVAGLSGLQNYKFGKSITVSPSYKDVISEVPYETIIANRERGLHTLLYLDISMSIAEALKLLEAVEAKKKGNELKQSIIVGIARAGSDNPVVKADYMDILTSFEFGALPHVLIVPGKLHFMEKEALIKIAHAPEDI